MHYVEMVLEGIPVIDWWILVQISTSFKVIIIGLELSNLKAPEHKAFIHDQKPITLDGKMDMTFSFGEKVLHATVYVKLVEPDQLLLSETVSTITPLRKMF